MIELYQRTIEYLYAKFYYLIKNIPLYAKGAIYEKFKAGDLEGAQAAQDAIASFRACFKYGNPNTIVKTAVGLLGYPVGKCRKPFYSMSEEGVAALKAVLEENKRNGMN